MNISEIIKCLKLSAENNKTLLFVSLSGSHVYGTPNINSDIDLRGCHIEPTEKILLLDKPNPTLELAVDKYDIVSHEIEKFLRLILRGNGNLYEWLNSPVIIFNTEMVSCDLKYVADKSLSKTIYNHYFGFATHMLEHCKDEGINFDKTIMYAFRNLLCGTHVLEEKKFVLNFGELCEIYNFELDYSKYREQADTLFANLYTSKENSSLKDKPEESDKKRANDLLLKLRAEYVDDD